MLRVLGILTSGVAVYFLFEFPAPGTDPSVGGHVHTEFSHRIAL